ncbi:MAG: M20/M25/M40 family metallo-hydrolase [Verrucomicrobia bacterium]|nr:M20/M25/M40 family metallo-hydrolase [Verrucomicrobiota bacterium]
MPSHLRSLLIATVLLVPSAFAQPARPPEPVLTPEEKVLRAIFTEALAHGQAYDNLRLLVTDSPGRLAGSKALERAVVSTEKMLNALGLDRVYKQDVMVPHWERGPKESVTLLPPAGTKGGGIGLTAVALGGSIASPKEGVTAEVIEVKSIDELATLGREKVAGKIVFFNRPMDPSFVSTGRAYGDAGDQRFRGPAAAGKYGAVAALTRSLSLSLDDVPHTGLTVYASDQPKVPAAALSTHAANQLSAALIATPRLRITVKVHSQSFPDAPSHNVIGEIRGTEFPDEIILVGGHLDSWDIAPGAHDNGAGCVQSIEVLRLFRTLGLKPRHTIRCVLFTNEENGTRGSTAYADLASKSGQKHLLAVETDNGGFQPRGFNLGSTQGPAHERAARWRPLFEPYGIYAFSKGPGGTDVNPLLVQGSTVAGLTPDSQRYFDYHHTSTDSLDKVNPRELHLGAAALASLIWLVDTQGL